MLEIVKFAVPFVLGSLCMLAIQPELQRLSDASYEQKISDLSTQVTSCQVKILEVQKILKSTP